MTDRELLELAAKAAGYPIEPRTEWIEVHKFSQKEPERLAGKVDFYLYGELWNPIEDDGDVLRLAVKLRLQIQVNDASIEVDFPQDDVGITRESVYQYPDSKLDDEDNIVHINHESATRRAIVLAAAEIGKGVQ